MVRQNKNLNIALSPLALSPCNYKAKPIKTEREIKIENVKKSIEVLKEEVIKNDSTT